MLDIWFFYIYFFSASKFFFSFTVTGSTSQDPTNLSRMGPPLPPEINMKMPSNHFDFGAIFPQLSGLEEFYVCYKVSKGYV